MNAETIHLIPLHLWCVPISFGTLQRHILVAVSGCYLPNPENSCGWVKYHCTASLQFYQTFYSTKTVDFCGIEAWSMVLWFIRTPSISAIKFIASDVFNLVIVPGFKKIKKYIWYSLEIKLENIFDCLGEWRFDLDTYNEFKKNKIFLNSLF